MKKIIVTILFLALFSIPKSNAQEFSKGADVTWLPQMEATGYQFFDTDGTKKDALQLLKDRGMNTVRLRVFVNPSDDPRSGHCSKEETVELALRAQKMGFRIMINFHYSDSWADPGKQNKPAAWKDLPFDKLANEVYNHTFEVMTALQKANVKTEWVQVGNEIPGGMLWPEGSTDNWVQLGKLLNKGYDAVKAVDKAIKVIVHLDEGDNIQKYRTFYDNATAQKVRYDVIGLSYYPFWVKKDYTETIANLEFNLNDLVKRYNKEVMVVEVGGEYDKVENTKALLEATIKAVRNVPNNKGLGVLYWEPQGEKSWSGYNLSAWLPDGKPSPALDAFKD
ncbi:arabinogalactan endo-1,4-beta-galactosidase [Flavobacterium lacus]|uniref:Arabinogalactan endo-beta-1,4-galactanase n=2 Tax=Flavobacterium lacus TaxID=1353778 RepID=A0A328WX77_9FLAO|nr:arabinogalactan endo-1,4-beta-galactosidase [Flavobacterium lacus]